MICTGEDVRHPPYKTQVAPPSFRRRWGGGGGSVGGDRLTQPPYDVTSVHSNPGAGSDRTRLPSHQQYCDLPRYNTVEVKSEPWGGHWLNPQTANQTCKKRKMQSFLLVFFQSVNFSCNTLLNNWLKKWDDFMSPLKTICDANAQT
jgi:hypothetical protein